MPYTQSLLANGDAIGYHAKAAPPTVTMPRLKVCVIFDVDDYGLRGLELLILVFSGNGFWSNWWFLGCGFQF